MSYNEMLTPTPSSIVAFEHEPSTNGYRTGLMPVTTAISSVRLTDLDEATEPSTDAIRKNLGLLLSRQLAEMHGGQILIQGVAEPGYRYVITLPRLTQ